RETAIKGGFQTRPYGNHPNRPMVDSRAWLTPKSAKAFSAGIRKSELRWSYSGNLNHCKPLYGAPMFCQVIIK
ncbi:MAG: hypothetical protein ABIF71_13155, partial [Planctomycetota bacterium]